MSDKSFIYRHINIYRFVMNLLYLGKYKKRFTLVKEELRNLPAETQVLELCFGDTQIADFCRKKNYQWIGLDINKQFVKEAQKKGYNAYLEDISNFEDLPRTKVCIMMGSLYHFHPHTEVLLSKMIKASDCIIISEPILNLSSAKGLIGFLARRAANAGKGKEEFRYNETSLLAMLEASSSRLGYQVALVRNLGKDLIVKLLKNGEN